MVITVKNSQLDNDTIQSINYLIELDINASSAFKLTRIINELSSIIDDKVKMEKRILDKWIEKDENGNPVQVKDENGNVLEGSVSLTDPVSFTNEMTSLMEVENQLSFDKLKFEELELKTAKIKDLMKLEFLFD